MGATSSILLLSLTIFGLSLFEGRREKEKSLHLSSTHHLLTPLLSPSISVLIAPLLPICALQRSAPIPSCSSRTGS